MSKNRWFTLFAIVVLLTTVAFTVQKVFSNMNTTYSESKEQTQREYKLGERYGGVPEGSNPFSVEQIHHEYVLGERYGVLSKEYTQQQAQREYWLGERYGQMPQILVIYGF